MRNNLISFLVGLLFALGLGISGMTQPARVVGFLDIFGAWDPSLLFVMAGAVLVHGVSYRLVRRRATPWFADKWILPAGQDITPALLVGAFIFGVGWGLGGYCPGPAVVSLASLQARPLVFVTSMILGMIVFRVVDKKMKIKK